MAVTHGQLRRLLALCNADDDEPVIINQVDSDPDMKVLDAMAVLADLARISVADGKAALQFTIHMVNIEDVDDEDEDEDEDLDDEDLDDENEYLDEDEDEDED